MIPFYLYFRENLVGVSIFVELDGKVIYQPIPQTAVTTALSSLKTVSGGSFSVVASTAENGR